MARLRLALAVLALMTLVFPSSMTVAPVFVAPTAHPVGAVPFVGTGAATNATSYNWAGYVATGSSGQVTKVFGTWHQPAAKCNRTSPTSMVAIWVGLDGYNSSTVEQIGTLAQCSEHVASYYAWWDVYPSESLQRISTITVHSGDIFTASVVSYPNSSHNFTLKIEDTSTQVSFSTTASQPNATESSAEWIVEAPSGDNSTVSGIYPLAHFREVLWTKCTATLAGKLHDLRKISSLVAITMVSYPSGARTLASPLLESDIAFLVSWENGS